MLAFKLFQLKTLSILTLTILTLSKTPSKQQKIRLRKHTAQIGLSCYTPESAGRISAGHMVRSSVSQTGPDKGSEHCIPTQQLIAFSFLILEFLVTEPDLHFLLTQCGSLWYSPLEACLPVKPVLVLPS